MSQRNALGFGGDDVVVFGGARQQLPGAGDGQFLVAEDYKARNGEFIVDRADGKIPLQACNFHMIIHGKNAPFPKNL